MSDSRKRPTSSSRDVFEQDDANVSPLMRQFFAPRPSRPRTAASSPLSSTAPSDKPDSTEKTQPPSNETKSQTPDTETTQPSSSSAPPPPSTSHSKSKFLIDDDDEDEDEDQVESVDTPIDAHHPTAKDPPPPHLPVENKKHEDDDRPPLEKSLPLAETCALPSSSPGSDKLLFSLWEPGQPVPYLALAKTFEEIARISSRLKIMEHLMHLYLEIIRRTPCDLLPAVYLSVNKLAPAYHGLELGVGESLIQKAICDATGRTMSALKADYDQVGDLGLIAQQSKSNQKLMITPPPLTIRAVYRRFLDIAKLTGNSSMSHKKGWIQGLLVAARDCEPQFIVRSLQGKLRIGLAEKSVLVSLANASYVARAARPEAALKQQEGLEEAAKRLRAVYSELPSYELVVPALLEAGTEGLSAKCHLTPGIPVEPMLAHPTKGIGEVFERLGSKAFTCEFKYDGERAQIHRLEDGVTSIYSRNAENNTGKYPDIMVVLPEAMREGTASFIIDCEAVAVDAASNALLPFQRLSTRSRKDVSLESIKVPVCLFAFDLLYLNGRSLLRETFRERRRLLEGAFRAIPHKFCFAVHRDCADDVDMQAFLESSIEGQCEGLMVKTLDDAATYEPARRSYNWLKVKKDYLEGVADSIDLVPIGADFGKGKRTGCYGAYLLACYDAETEQFQAVTRIGTGFSDAVLEQLTQFFKEHVRPAKPSDYFVGDAAPDVWLAPAQVWEVRVADLSLSSAYKGAFGVIDPQKGISLRFPRFIRVRDDKKPHHATSSEQIAELYRSQALVSGAQPSSSNQVLDDEFEF